MLGVGLAKHAFIAALLLAAPVSTSGRKQHGPDLVAALRVGQWLRLKGVVQRDASVQCTEVKLLTGDFLDDDWSLKGRVSSIDLGRGRFAIGPFPVKVADKTVFENPKGTLRGLSDLRIGMIVEIDGTYTRDRILVASEVDDESDETRHMPWSDRQIQIEARIERVDTERRRITAMHTVFQVVESTQLKSPLR